MENRLLHDTEVVNLLVGEVDWLTTPALGFFRLNKASLIEDWSEVAQPTRFIVLYMQPASNTSSMHCDMIGRAFGALFTDQVLVTAFILYNSILLKLKNVLVHRFRITYPFIQWN